MGDNRVRQQQRVRRAPPHGTGDDEERPDGEAPPTPEQELERATAAVDRARARAGRSLRQSRRPELRPRPALDLTVHPERPETLQEAQERRIWAQLRPAEQRGLREAVAGLVADDAVDKLDQLVGVLNRIRSRRNERRGGEAREPVSIDREAVREAVAQGVELGLEAGVEYLLRTVLTALLGEPNERQSEGHPLGELPAPPEMERLHPDERRFVLQLPPIPLG